MPKRPLPAASRSRVRRTSGKRRGLRERPHRPGRGRVEAGAGIAGLAHEPSPVVERPNAAPIRERRVAEAIALPR